MAVVGNHMRNQGKLKKDTIVATVMSNLGFFQMGETEKLHMEQTKVGDRYVLERMREIGASLGGEQSGHVIFLDENTTGDGLLSALHLLEVMVDTGKPLSELAKVMEVLPQALVNAKVANHKKEKYMEYPEIAEAFKRYAWEEAEHAAKFAELLGEIVWDTKTNVKARMEAECGACEDKKRIATLAKKLNLDAIHDTVHEMCKDEARHGKGFEGLYNRYFKK